MATLQAHATPGRRNSFVLEKEFPTSSVQDNQPEIVPIQGEIGNRARKSRRTFVLCFDGTGNKFSGTDSDSNILKIYRMLDRDDSSQFHYYQPGIGTYIASSSFSQHTSNFDKFISWYALYTKFSVFADVDGGCPGMQKQKILPSAHPSTRMLWAAIRYLSLSSRRVLISATENHHSFSIEALTCLKVLDALLQCRR